MQCGVAGGIRDEADVPVRTDGDEPPLADPEGRRQYRVALANLTDLAQQRGWPCCSRSDTCMLRCWAITVCRTALTWASALAMHSATSSMLATAAVPLLIWSTNHQRGTAARITFL